jgi:hypothetical protein
MPDQLSFRSESSHFPGAMLLLQNVLPLPLYVLISIAFGVLWCLALSIPISLASTIVGPGLELIVYLAIASALISAAAYPLLRKPLTRAKFWIWPVPFSILMAQVFGIIVVFVSDWKSGPPGNLPSMWDIWVAILAGVAYGTLYGLGSLHVAYPVAMLQLWILNCIRRIWFRSGARAACASCP